MGGHDTIETVRSSKLFEKVWIDNNYKSVPALKLSDNDKHKTKQQFKCSNCYTKFSNKMELNWHIKSVHYEYQCSECLQGT